MAIFDLKYILSNIIYSITLYPFICSIFSIIRSFKTGNFRNVFADKTTISLLLFGIIFFNPISVSIIGAELKLYLFELKTPSEPMVEVVEILPNSPIKDRPLKVGDKIYKIEIYKLGEEYSEKRDNVTYIIPNVTDKKTFRIRNSSDFYEALNEAKSWDSIRFTTLKRSFDTKIPKNITDWGIKVKDVQLKRMR